MAEYLVTFERIGRNHDVQPLTVGAVSGDELAEAVYDYARPMLVSRDIEVFVNLDEGRGFIACGMAHNGGNFVIQPKDAGVPRG